MSPLSFRMRVYLLGSPALVVTKVTPWSTTNCAMEGSRTNACAMLTPKGLSVSSRMARISSLMASSSPELVSMMPSPPALHTALASWDRAIQPIGACTIGRSTPSNSVTRFVITR
ncbi:Uncharacterised protein [Mycobacteroides abscessus subsp. abscessus]|nr:Uncharacterised protein [Mycobacteroides abscessus subsp. abscessus]